MAIHSGIDTMDDPATQARRRIRGRLRRAARPARAGDRPGGRCYGRPVDVRRLALRAGVPIAVLAIVAAVLVLRGSAPAGPPPSDETAGAETDPAPAEEPEPEEAPGPEGPAAEQPPAEPPAPESDGAEPLPEVPPQRRTKAPRAPFHTMNPCTAVQEGPIPEGYEDVTAAGVTVAWPKEEIPDFPPMLVAHLAAGLLEEAAALTGTARREELTVIVYPTSLDFHEKSGAPSWASGFYDGAVKLPASPTGEFGVRTRSLRHEVMHAQLHARVGCVPVWLHEGAASYFGLRAPRATWISMLRRRSFIEPPALEVPTVEEVTGADVDIVYAQSLAMVLHAIERSGDASLRPVVRAIRRLRIDRDSRGRVALWPSLYPEMTGQGLHRWLGERLFGLRAGPELDAALAGGVCCLGANRVRQMSCYGVAAQPGQDLSWSDSSRGVPATCSND